jgi:hypothetical protein
MLADQIFQPIDRFRFGEIEFQRRLADAEVHLARLDMVCARLPGRAAQAPLASGIALASTIFYWQPGSLKLPIRVCQPAGLLCCPASV